MAEPVKKPQQPKKPANPNPQKPAAPAPAPKQGGGCCGCGDK